MKQPPDPALDLLRRRQHAVRLQQLDVLETLLNVQHSLEMADAAYFQRQIAEHGFPGALERRRPRGA